MVGIADQHPLRRARASVWTRYWHHLDCGELLRRCVYDTEQFDTTPPRSAGHRLTLLAGDVVELRSLRIVVPDIDTVVSKTPV